MTRLQVYSRGKLALFVFIAFVFTFSLLYVNIERFSGDNYREVFKLKVICAATECNKNSPKEITVLSTNDVSFSKGFRRLHFDTSLPSDLASTNVKILPRNLKNVEKIDSGISMDITLKAVKFSADDHRESIPKRSTVDDRKISNHTNYNGQRRFIKRLPKVLIIGVKKGGTKALLTFLSAHPDVRSCAKEVHFFDKFYHRGLKWYLEKMPRSFPHEITLEKSPRYFVTTNAPKRVHDLSPNMKLLVILRNPTERAVSDFVHMKVRKKRYRINDTLDSIVFVNSSKHWKSVNKSVVFIRNGLYSTHLKHWLKHFQSQQIHFVNGDAMISNPGKELRKVQKFLQLETLVDEQNFVYNTTKGFYCVRKTLQDRQTKEPKAICLGKSKGRKHPRVSETTLQALRDFYKPYNEELYKMTGIDFEWK